MADVRDIVTPYYEALRRGELLIQQCTACQKSIMYPKHRCPHCQSAELGWQRASGQGTLHSIAIQRVGAPTGFEADLPYAVGVVVLDEGVRLLARLQPDDDGGWDSYICDGPVRFRAQPGTAEVRGPAAWFEAVDA
jgi:uncharacterized OB-fold protein